MEKEIIKKIKELKEKGEIIPATYDSVFKCIIQDEDLKDFVAYIISNIDGRIIDIDDMIFVNTESTKNTIFDKVNVSDIIIEIDSNKINLEMNKKNSKKLRSRNKAHFYDEALKTINVSYRIGEEKYFEQINFDNVFIKDELISIYKRVNIKSLEEDEDEKNLIKYRVNMANVYKKYYTDGKELTRFEKAIGILSFKKIKDLRKLAKGDNMLMKVVKKLEYLCENPDMIKLIDDEKAMEFGHKQDIKEAEKKAHDSGYSEGEALGSQKEKIEIAKRMLKMKIDIEDISQATNLSIDEIEKL